MLGIGWLTAQAHAMGVASFLTKCIGDQEFHHSLCRWFSDAIDKYSLHAARLIKKAKRPANKKSSACMSDDSTDYLSDTIHFYEWPCYHLVVTLRKQYCLS